MRATLGLIGLISGCGLTACGAARPPPAPAPEGPVPPVLGLGEQMPLDDGGLALEGDGGPDGAPDASGSAVTILIRNVHASAAFAVDDTGLYWIDEVAGEVSRAPKRGGLTMTLYNTGGRALASGSTLAVQGGDIYWATDLDMGAFRQSALMRLPKNADKPTLLASSSTGRLSGPALDGQSVYWVSGGAIVRAPKAGGPSTQVLAGQAGADAVAVDDQSVYVSCAGTEGKQFADGTIVAVAKKGGAPRVLVAGSAHAANVQIDDQNAYWQAGADVVSVPKAGGPAKVLATATGPVDDLALDDTNVYFASHTSAKDGTIARVPKAGGPVEVLASASSPATGIAVDATAVYWMGLGTEANKFADGTVNKRDKP
ncbi:MAG TPA: hypothetical protein VKU41_19500 [Polyangiaceae bacterium]|nr:hypothetical protein [Polyangiaceae bacterium]